MLMKNKQSCCGFFFPLHRALYQSSALIHTETPDQLLGEYKDKSVLQWYIQQMPDPHIVKHFP